jgi:hypothetical protein
MTFRSARGDTHLLKQRGDRLFCHLNFILRLERDWVTRWIELFLIYTDASKPAAGKPARVQQPAGTAARRAGRPHRSWKPAVGREGDLPPGDAPRRGPRRPPRPLGSLVEKDTRKFLFVFLYYFFTIWRKENCDTVPWKEKKILKKVKQTEATEISTTCNYSREEQT